MELICLSVFIFYGSVPRFLIKRKPDISYQFESLSGNLEWSMVSKAGMGPRYLELWYFGTGVLISQYLREISAHKKYLYSYLYSSILKINVLLASTNESSTSTCHLQLIQTYR